ncbi:MAG: acetyl-CoA carboxylase biotin carboxyl carrier protein [Planctomycetes bacterium]|nr:acetyl-CoA carboxylase biotin carboxyl carrier protein [Planctomycetota bacterium]
MAKKRPEPSKKSSPSGKSAAASAANDRLSHLERLIELMEAKDVVEVELQEGATRWRVRRKDPTPTVAYAAPAAMAMPAMPVAHAASVSAAPAAAAGGAAEPQGEVFKSPMLGTYYRAASPEAEAFCKVGDRVAGDRTLCIIEAMKVMNEIKAEREFEILEILVKNGEPVEFGQPLFLIR